MQLVFHWYFIIFLNIFFHDPSVTFENMHACFEDFFYNEDDFLIFSRNVRKSSASCENKL